MRKALQVHVMQWRLLVSMAAAMAHAGAAQPQECDFDQDQIAKRLRESVQRAPGGKLSADGHSVTWLLPTGETVSVHYGGCAHLGAQVEVSGVTYNEQRAIERIVEATRTYWSSDTASSVSAALSSGKLSRRKYDDGAVELSSRNADGFGYTIRASPKTVSLSWDEG